MFVCVKKESKPESGEKEAGEGRGRRNRWREKGTGQVEERIKDQAYSRIVQVVPWSGLRELILSLKISSKLFIVG